jgi:hypothetical protein
LLGYCCVHALDCLGHRRAELVHGVEINALLIACGEHLVRGSFELLVEAASVQGQAVLVDERTQRRVVGTALEQREGRRIVDARCHGHAGLERRALGLVLQARVVHRTRAGADEIEARLLHGGDHRFVLGHEAVAGEYGVVVIVAGDAMIWRIRWSRSSLLAPV